MLRDSYKNEEYFNSYIKKEQERISRFENVLKIFEGKDYSREIECRKHISSFKKNIISAMYSVGATKEEMKPLVAEYLAYANQSGNISYADYIDALSFIILFNIDNAKYIMSEMCYSEDSLVSVLKNYILDNNVKKNGTNLIFPDQYRKFLEYVNGDINDSEFGEFMNNGWYSSNSNAYWYNSHLSSNDTYNGYWSWLGATLIKICNGSLDKYYRINNIPLQIIQ